jgi:hypothetical protein
MKSRSIQKNAEVGIVFPDKRTKPVTVWQLPDRYRRQRRENAGRRLISQPDMESKHPIIAAARLK